MRILSQFNRPYGFNDLHVHAKINLTCFHLKFPIFIIPNLTAQRNTGKGNIFLISFSPFLMGHPPTPPIYLKRNYIYIFKRNDHSQNILRCIQHTRPHWAFAEFRKCSVWQCVQTNGLGTAMARQLVGLQFSKSEVTCCPVQAENSSTSRD